MVERNNNKVRRIADFYNDKSIFITGASGFMGKVLVEKILYSCSNVKNVYILIRPKRQKSIETRLEEMFRLPMFQRIQRDKPQAFKKVIPVPGDLLMHRLGISEDLRRKIIEEVSIVFHGAATLRLEANLKDAMEMNTWGTWRVLELAKELKHLEVFVHLSTAFCHVDQEVLEEKAYGCKYDPKDFMRLVEWMDIKTLDKITPEMISPHPNTYTFTKRLAERLIIQEYPNMPVCIARPSIVCPSHMEPIPGWVDSLNGPVGILVAAGKGVLRSMYVKPELTAELIPVDFAINGILAIAKEVASEPKPSEIPVFNMTQAEEKTTTWGDILRMGKDFTFEIPFSLILWFPGGDIRSSLWVHKFYAFFLHWIPAYLIDGLLFIFRQKRFMIHVQKKIEVGLEVLQYFTTHKWKFKNEKFIQIREKMCPEDKKEFNLNFKEIKEYTYLRNAMLGAREHTCKDPLDNLPRARRMIKVMYVVDKLFRFLFILFIANLLIKWSGTASYIFDETGKNLKHVPFFRSFVPHEDIPVHRQG